MKNGNVIDMTERIQEPRAKDYLRGLKVRFDLENAKVAVSTSLLSIVVLVTLANNNLLNTGIASRSGDDPMVSERVSRGIASVQSITTNGIQASALSDSPQLLKELSNRDLGPNASVGQKPSALERLAFGTLEGRYAVRLHNGMLKEIELSEGINQIQGAKDIESAAAFIGGQRELLPDFERVLKVGSENEPAGGRSEIFQLVNEVSMPVAKVLVRIGENGKLLALRVFPASFASK